MVVYFTSDDIHQMNLLFETEDYVRAWANVDDAFFSYPIGVSYKQRVTTTKTMQRREFVRMPILKVITLFTKGYPVSVRVETRLPYGESIEPICSESVLPGRNFLFLFSSTHTRQEARCTRHKHLLLSPFADCSCKDEWTILYQPEA